MSQSTRFFKQFLVREQSAVLVLLAATFVALLWAQTPWRAAYEAFWHYQIHLEAGGVALGFSLHRIVNDGLMALFFLHIGCELKRERVAGELATAAQARLPFVAALGGMVVPALLYALVNLWRDPGFSWQSPTAMGWAIPTATDIAFAIGLMGLLGKRVPSSLRVFLLALAVIDDLGAVVIIGFFYAQNFQFLPLLGVAFCSSALWFMNKKGVASFGPYALLGLVLWVFTAFSGLHATLAGLFLALALPLRVEKPLLPKVERKIHPWISFGVLPLFALANAGVPMIHVSPDVWESAVWLGVMAGLVIGKPLGVMGATALMVRFGLAPKPYGARWRQIGGVALLCGIGFTMSLFISLLAFQDPVLQDEARLGLVGGSALAALLGLVVLGAASPKKIPAKPIKAGPG